MQGFSRTGKRMRLRIRSSWLRSVTSPEFPGHRPADTHYAEVFIRFEWLFEVQTADGHLEITTVVRFGESNQAMFKHSS